MVEHLSECLNVEHPISFAEKVFGRTETETCELTLKSGTRISVHRLVEIIPLTGRILPVPGYIFKNCNDWLRGIFWDRDPKLLLLNEGEVECILRSA
jgi:hypothetical protein